MVFDDRRPVGRPQAAVHRTTIHGKRGRMLCLSIGCLFVTCCRGFVLPRPIIGVTNSAARVGRATADRTKLWSAIDDRSGPPKGFDPVMDVRPTIMAKIAKATKLEERELNKYVNAAFLLVVGAAVLTKVLTVDVEAWRGWQPSEILFRIPIDNWEEYMSFLTEQPVVTKGLTSFSVYLLGDWVAQTSEGKTLGEIDRGRVARSALAGLIGHGPLSHVWYQVSEGLFSNLLGWTEWWSVMPKIAVDQLVWGPIWNGCYMVLLGTMKRESLKEVVNTVRTTSIPLLVSGLKLWPLAHVITYGLIPMENRLLWVDFVEILWVTILSRQAAAGAADPHGHGGADKQEDVPVETGTVMLVTEGEDEGEGKGVVDQFAAAVDAAAGKLTSAAGITEGLQVEKKVEEEKKREVVH